MSAFKLLCDRLRNEATLAKSDGAGAFKKQSLDPDLKGGKKGKKPAGSWRRTRRSRLSTVSA